MADQNSVKMNGKGKSRKKKASTETNGDEPLDLEAWNEFYVSHKFGIGVECTSCKKWRRVKEFFEAHEVPEDWVCSMTEIDGQKGRCDIPTKLDENSFVDELYVPGSIVWAKCKGYPWWPAMVEDDPDLKQYHLEGEDGGEYHVVYFNERPSREWVANDFITAFVKPPPDKGIKKGKPNLKMLERRLKMAENQAKVAVTMSLAERFKNFSFSKRLQAKRSNASKIEPSTPKRRRDKVSEIEPSTSKREVKATAKQFLNLSIKKRKTLAASVPSTSQISTTVASKNPLIIPAEHSPCCIKAAHLDLISDAESGFSEISVFGEVDELLQPPSPYPVPPEIKSKAIDELFSDVENDDLCLNEVEENEIIVEQSEMREEEKFIITENGELEKYCDYT